MLLLCNVLIPIMTAIVIVFINSARYHLIRAAGLASTISVCVVTAIILLKFDKLSSDYQELFSVQWVDRLNWEFVIGIDGISIWFVVLTAFIFPLCVVKSWNRVKDLKLFIVCFLVLESFLLLAFTSVDLFLFYIFFEATLIPMYFIIGVWGSGPARIKAAYYFMLYTLFGSVFFLYGLFLVQSEYGTTNLLLVLNSSKELTDNTQLTLFFCFGFGFAIKMPLFPFHLWLPEAHVQAPTEGSVILASLLLKLGGYGFIRVLIPLTPYGMSFTQPLMTILALCGVLYGSLFAIAQEDLKKLIAYSSVAHMGLVTLGIFSGTIQGIQGAIFLMIGHGLASSGLFFMVGYLYDRHHTRNINYYGGLIDTMPIFSGIFLFFIASNVGFPGTAGFVGEILIFAGVYINNPIVAIFASPGILLSTIYSFWLYNRLCFLSPKTSKINKFKDLTRIELYTLVILILAILLLGINPNLVLDVSDFSVQTLIANRQ